jgi:hypothetical protein
MFLACFLVPFIVVSLGPVDVISLSLPEEGEITPTGGKQQHCATSHAKK